MENIIALVRQYQNEDWTLRQKYIHNINSTFGDDLLTVIGLIRQRLIQADQKEVDRYLKLYKHFSERVDDNIVKQMLHEKLQQEYTTILGIQREIGLMMKLTIQDDEDMMNVKMSVDSIIDNMLILNTLFSNLFDNTMKDTLYRFKRVHDIHHDIFMNVHENSRYEEYDKETFRLTDEEISNINKHIADNASIKPTQYDIFEANTSLLPIKCFNE